jgi:hypothetical protein
MSVPPPPPRPNYNQNLQNPNYSNAPPVPPLPPGFRPDVDGIGDSPPHFIDPLVAPRPQKLMSSVPADVSHSSLFVSSNYGYRYPHDFMRLSCSVIIDVMGDTWRLASGRGFPTILTVARARVLYKTN